MTFSADKASRLVDRVTGLKVGAGTEEDVQIGPLIDEAAVCKVESHVAAHGLRDISKHGRRVEQFSAGMTFSADKASRSTANLASTRPLRGALWIV
jgi:acyl-CoA reductase-like NAD-dependent aldehyde dehydrogenase